VSLGKIKSRHRGAIKRKKHMHRFPRLHEALDYAAEAHNGQVRKQTTIPYLAHLLGVCSLVLDYGGDEDQAIAALLHDVIEDCGESHRQAVPERFGARVGMIVEGCTDGTPDETGAKAPWRDRKEAYLAHLRAAPADVLLVSACDKLHNARAIVADRRVVGDAVFDRFKAGRDGTVWYYRELAGIFSDRLSASHSLSIELSTTIAQLD
jgi:(p)ppGpp synthase/HD superfamily hydrolase